MWQQFTSSFFNKVDTKGRVSIPALWRKALELRNAEGNIVLVPGFRDKNCVEGYAPDEYQRMSAAVSRMHPSDPNRRKLEYRLMGRALPLQLDDNGRIVLPKEMRDRFDLGGDVAFVGTGDSFQIWSKARYDEMIAPLDDDEDFDALSAMPWDGPEASL
tara:strand:+ start:528 stop:1004 length:477 start_codon:yes stop_codon:yes gene_type:complete